jgi:transposase-like protein
VLIPRKESNAMKSHITTATALAPPVLEPVLGSVDKAFEDVRASFDRFCLTAGIKALGEMMEKEAQEVCGPRHSRGEERGGYRWGRTRGKIAFHAGKVEIERPRVRDFAGRELVLRSWENATAQDWLGKWAMNLMLLNVSTRKFRRAVRLPEGDVPAPAGSGVSKSAASRHFVALSSARLQEWLGADLSRLDILVVQIDGIHISQDLVLVAAIGIDGDGIKHPLALMEGATENAAGVQALIDSLLARGLDPAVPRLFIVDGSKALWRAIRRSFGRDTAIQRCQIHKARNIMDRLPKALHASGSPRATPSLGTR